MRWTPRIHHHATSASSTPTPRPDAVPTPQPDATEVPKPAEAVTLLQVTDVPEGCRIAVLGPPGTLRSLDAALPTSWTIDRLEEVADLPAADLIVVTSPTPDAIAAVRARQPDASIVALAQPAAGVDAVVELLQGGATACVRSAETGLVAAHLVACARRYAVGAT
ncbi:MAG TPA: hypothetical protein VLR26_15265 [Frankiaceae bacterium]|nr:hypothetical protein [Frankiaceae bacterium]